ncbi:hypothetical protein PR202_gb06310 [Eleusine coracana subsp. coracana]|uniref:F-box associated beta-propeller type 3 domain-containing protein n=1 Tax=Eleusine coracana subsp. coracana TaxID=191504 RepID=A0AAV5E9L7_ELECO|nr:hypothetical protein QOZ80_2BG0156030 [Eleusine coracana subsp. coracana]GJN19073.1 hypothetical protein PR202_gb06310 [Eleusine coracana subsp. coracana]
MAKKKERKDYEIEAAAAPPRKPSSVTMKRRKRRRNSKRTRRTSGAVVAPGIICDDIIRSIFARLPARTLVASTTLSKHHRSMILSPEFRNLHCRLGPPLPAPHIAYIARAKIKSGHSKVVSAFHSFNVAAARRPISCDAAPAPPPSLTGPKYLGRKYINTCNGVVLLAGGGEHRRRCVLWNPCIANSDKEVVVPAGCKRGDRVLGFGYGNRTQAYKLLLLSRTRDEDDLLVYPLGDTAGAEQPQLRTVFSAGKHQGEENFFYNPSRKPVINSLYIDGIIYLLHVPKELILAFDVDNETVTTISLPGKGHISNEYIEKARLMEMSGRPCIETYDWKRRTLWVLSVDYQWEPKCVIKSDKTYNNGDFDNYSITGAWDCGGGVLLLHVYHDFGGPNQLYILHPSTKKTKVIRTTLPCNLMPELSEYAFCWGYKPTLVSPGSIIGEHSQEEGHTTTDIFESLNLLNEQEKKKGHEATLTTMCLMEFLVDIMRRLPENMQEVAKMLRKCL